MERLVRLHPVAVVLTLVLPLGQHRLLPVVEPLAHEHRVPVELLPHGRLLLLALPPLRVAPGLRAVKKQPGKEKQLVRPAARPPVPELLPVRAGVLALVPRVALPLLFRHVVPVRLSPQHV